MTNKPHPCPAPPPAWWASWSDEILTDGPFDTREDAINEVLGQGSYQEIEPDGWDWTKPASDPVNADLKGWKAGIYVGKYQRRHINLAECFIADQWIDDIYDRMDDENGADENGENHPLDEMTPEDITDLQESVRSAIWHWQERKQKKLRCYYMDGQCDYVTMPHPDEATD